MTEMREIKGQCLCGAVTVAALYDGGPLSACHCDMCRRHSSSLFIGVAADQSSIVVKGPAKSFRSSEWAERGFCSECGSTLWYGTVHDGARYLGAGLFDNAAGGAISVEYFADQCPEGYRLEGIKKRLSAEATIALFSDGSEEGV